MLSALIINPACYRWLLCWRYQVASDWPVSLMKSSRHSLGGAERRRTRRSAGSSPAVSTSQLRAELRKLDSQMSKIAWSPMWYKLASKSLVKAYASLDKRRKDIRARIKKHRPNREG